MTNTLTVEEITQVLNSVKKNGFFDYVIFARAILAYADEKRGLNAPLNAFNDASVEEAQDR